MEKDKLILYPTETSQWYALINEAESARALQLGEELESYLVFLLMRFASQPEMVASIIAMEFLEGLNKLGNEQQDCLRNVGDKCLLFSGLFPDNAKRRQLSADYFVEVGQTAYGTLSSLEEENSAALFYQLGQHFVTLKDVLQATRNLPEVTVLLRGA